MPQNVNTRNSLIQIRLKPQEMKGWVKFAKENNFSSLSQLIRFSVNEVIAKGLKQELSDIKNRNNEMKMVKNKVETIHKNIENVENENRELREFMRGMNLIKKDKNLKRKVFRVLKKKTFDSEELAFFLLIPDSKKYILMSALDDLMREGLIKMDLKSRKYRVVHNHQ